MANEEQIEYWNEKAGPQWAESKDEVDRMIEPHLHALLELAAPVAGEQVLDVGCGAGATTVELARRVVPGGRVLGIDISAPLLDAAKLRTRGLDNVELSRDDVQVGNLGSGCYDLVVSRFGVMFFDQPAEAFGNLRSAAREEGRLAFICWQSLARNPWVALPIQVVQQHLDLPRPEPGAPGPFAFADCERTQQLLEEGGWSSIMVEPFTHPVALASSTRLAHPVSEDEVVESALDFLQRIGPLSRLLMEVEDAARRATILQDVRAELARHVVDGRLELGSSAWLVSARA